MTLYDVAWIFLIYGFVGWCCEVAFAAIVHGRFVNRGFLNGPICPIYGVGALAVVLLLSPLRGHLVLLFLASGLVATVIELVTGWALEKLFHTKWWDYSNYKFNYKGYICPQFSLLWGAACTVIVRWVNPGVLVLVNQMPRTVGWALACVFFTVLAVDLAVTAAGVLRLRARMDELRYVESMLQDISEVIGEGLSDGVLLARETLTIEKAGQLKDKMLLKALEKRDELEAMRQELMGRVPAIHRRIFQAFPSLQDGSYRHIIETIREHWGGSR